MEWQQPQKRGDDATLFKFCFADNDVLQYDNCGEIQQTENDNEALPAVARVIDIDEGKHGASEPRREIVESAINFDDGHSLLYSILSPSCRVVPENSESDLICGVYEGNTLRHTQLSVSIMLYLILYSTYCNLKLKDSYCTLKEDTSFGRVRLIW